MSSTKDNALQKAKQLIGLLKSNGIDVSENLIELSNGEIVFVGDTFGGLSDEVMKVQVRKTIEEHFLKERKLKSKGIKVLFSFLCRPCSQLP